MNNFQYYTPTRVVFGKDAESQVGELVASLNCKKTLVHFGGQSAKKSGLLDRIFKSLDASGVSCVSLRGVVPNPRLSKVHEGIELCRKEGVDFILAVGGGSVIDSAKAIGYGLASEGEVWDFYLRKRAPTGCTPIGCVLTISAAGSEMSDSSVITNEDGWIKRGYSNDLCRLKFAIMNPALTFTLPWFQVASGATDIMMHTMERWFDPKRTDSELTDYIAAGLIKTVMRNALILKNDPQNYNAAAEVMWASSLSHNGLTNCGGGGGDWSTHQIEHELGGMFDVAHGAGLAAVWGSWARYVYKALPKRFALFGRDIFGLPCASSAPDSETNKAALAAIEKTEAFFQSIDMPTAISGLGVAMTEEQIKELAWKCSFCGSRKLGAFMPLDTPDLEAIYRAAK
ncbi:MAG: iron-containing alcohol dehydrogenase [Treponema sp.]|jgi:alcohol dehydrogenase YqhD (iron-dependent ADH family)|nr:iron-containing alcohol dehydrogenase [Treponema sp.]